jgi:hypothetical protein
MDHQNEDKSSDCSVKDFLAKNNDDDDLIINDNSDDDSSDVSVSDQEALGQETPIPSASIFNGPERVQEL